MFKNVYFYRARLLPALITSIPMLIFINKVFAVKYANALQNVYDVLPIIAHLGLSVAIIFLFVQVNRLIAKEMFQRIYFNNELHMPTTNHLLINNTHYPFFVKNKIRDKIFAKFQVNLPDAQEESQDENNARKIISVAVSQIRIALKDNSIILQHNIEYGFWRNLIGGSLLSVLFSIAIFFYGKYFHLIDQQSIGAICFIVYSLPLFFSKFIIKKYGNYYSKILFEQFLSLA